MAAVKFISIFLLFSLLCKIHGYNNTCITPSLDKIKQRVEYHPSVDMTKLIFDIKLDEECEIARCKLFINRLANSVGFYNLLAIVETELFWQQNGSLNVVTWIGNDIHELCSEVEFCSMQLTCSSFAGTLIL